MPALPNVPNVIRTALKFAIGEDTQALIRFFLNFTGASPTNAELATLAGVVSGAYLAHLAAEATPDRVLEEVTITDLSSPTAAVGVDSTSHVGTLSGPELPADVCVLESRHIARRFRGGHSRIYWPFFSQAELNDPQTWKPTPLANLDTALTAFDAAILAAPWAGATLVGSVSVSYYQGFTVHTGVTGRARNVSTVRVTPLVDQVVARTMQPGVASQRKRLLRLA